VSGPLARAVAQKVSIIRSSVWPGFGDSATLEASNDEPAAPPRA
jgi:hypothetical protein